MPNLLNQNPIVIDSPGAGVLLTRSLDIQLIKWVSPSAIAGHIATIQDQNGNLKWTSCANGANYSESDFVDFDCAGLIVPVLGSGQLLIYVH